MGRPVVWGPKALGYISLDQFCCVISYGLLSSPSPPLLWDGSPHRTPLQWPLSTEHRRCTRTYEQPRCPSAFCRDGADLGFVCVSMLWLFRAEFPFIHLVYACAWCVQSCDQQILPTFLGSRHGPGSGVDAGNMKVPVTQPLPLRGSQGGRRDESETERGSGTRALLPGLWGSSGGQLCLDLPAVFEEGSSAEPGRGGKGVTASGRHFTGGFIQVGGFSEVQEELEMRLSAEPDE